MHVNDKTCPPDKVIRSFVGALLILLLVFSLQIVKAVSEAPPIQWQQVFEGTGGCSVLQTEDEGFLVTGANASASLLLRTDSSGNLLWTKAYQIGGNEIFLPYLVQTEDGGYALAGTLENKFILVRVDSEGNILWNKTYEHSSLFNYLRSFIRTNDGGYALVGTYLYQPPSDGQTWFVKVDTSGRVQWNKTIGSIGDFVNSVLQTGDGGYAIIGTIWASETLPATPKIIKTDPEGNEEWSKTYGGVGKGKFFYTESFSGVVTKEGGYLIAGFAGESSSSWVAWLFRTDSKGNMIWNKTYGDVGSLANTIIKTRSGGYAFAGVVNKKDAWLVKTDAYGSMDWNLTFEGSSIETFCNCMLQTNDGGYALVGTKGDKIWFVKIAALSPLSTVILPLIIIVILAIAIGITVAVYSFRVYDYRNSKKICGKGVKNKEKPYKISDC
ncbi:MAG: hypothetical protein NWE80_01730 [Candidatus Bathyarchaeota archaeon]|nr:hypothetical protein [Candidatus Bathyarchaeota archaeon]